MFSPESKGLSDDDEVKRIKDRKHTIRSQSPFTQYFIEAENEVDQLLLASNDSELEKPNDLQNEEFIRFLQNEFMGYAFLWASFTLDAVRSFIPINERTASAEANMAETHHVGLVFSVSTPSILLFN